MQQRISPASAITGAITLPGDKSISHRYAMISAIADGESRIHNYSTGADCHSTLGCVRALGIDVEVAGTEVRIKGKGLDGLRAPTGDLDAGNSGSTIRMLSGILAAQPFLTRIFGDGSLSMAANSALTFMLSSRTRLETSARRSARRRAAIL